MVSEINEALTIGTCIRDSLNALSRLEGVVGEVVVADNGSADGSPAIATAHGARVVSVIPRGYGAALRHGISAAYGQYVIIADADGSYDFGEIGRFLRSLEGGVDLVVGCRLPSGGGTIIPGAMPPLHRWIGTPCLTFLCRCFFDVKIHDVNCGMRGLRRESFADLGLTCDGMEFASEMIFKAALARMRIAEIPITLYPDKRNRQPHLRPWQDGWRHLSFMLLHSPLWVFVLPGLILLLIGALGVSFLVVSPAYAGGIAFDRNTFVISCMLILSGFQVTAIGVIARTYATIHRLLPANPQMERFRRALRLEHGLLLGGSLLFSGVILIAYALFSWWRMDFGALPKVLATRATVLGSTVILLGIQVVAASFFMSMVCLNEQKNQSP